MNIKTRINAIEQKVGIRGEPIVVFLPRRRCKDDNIAEHTNAVIIGSTADRCIDVFMNVGETGKEFEARVEEMSHAGD